MPSYLKIFCWRRKLQPGQDRTDGRTHTPTHTHTHTHTHSPASCDSYIELTASGLDKNCLHVHTFISLASLHKQHCWGNGASSLFPRPGQECGGYWICQRFDKLVVLMANYSISANVFCLFARKNTKRRKEKKPAMANAAEFLFPIGHAYAATCLVIGW